MEPNVLLVEDDKMFRNTVANVLKMNGFRTSEAGTGKEGVSKAREDAPDLIVLDLVMPGMSGLDVCQALKSKTATAGIPIIILTGHDQEGQDITCLDMGADGYLTKPVKTERLLAHCKALLRRPQPKAKPASKEKRLGGLRLDYARKLVELEGKPFPHLTPKEFDLLYELASASPEPRDRKALYRKVWGMEPPSEGSLKTVEVHVRRIRLKLGWRSREWLTGVSGRGYCLAPPEAG